MGTLAKTCLATCLLFLIPVEHFYKIKELTQIS